MKRVSSLSRFTLRYHTIDTTNVNIKRGREKETIRKVPKQFTIVKICEKKYICMENT